MARRAFSPDHSFQGRALTSEWTVIFAQSLLFVNVLPSQWVCISAALVPNCVQDALLVQIVNRSSHMWFNYYRGLPSSVMWPGKNESTTKEKSKRAEQGFKLL